jgi:hypothetical protein
LQLRNGPLSLVASTHIGTLEVAIREAERSDEVLKWPDDLNCGSIDPGDPKQRAAWWDWGEDGDFAADLRGFWARVAGRRKAWSSGSPATPPPSLPFS